jgi:hypothetical protein
VYAYLDQRAGIVDRQLLDRSERDLPLYFMTRPGPHSQPQDSERPHISVVPALHSGATLAS